MPKLSESTAPPVFQIRSYSALDPAHDRLAVAARSSPPPTAAKAQARDGCSHQADHGRLARTDLANSSDAPRRRHCVTNAIAPAMVTMLPLSQSSVIAETENVIPGGKSGNVTFGVLALPVISTRPLK